MTGANKFANTFRVSANKCRKYIQGQKYTVFYFESNHHTHNYCVHRHFAVCLRTTADATDAYAAHNVRAT